MDLIIRIIFGAPGFALAIMIHEAAHALAAYRLGDATAKNMGRISLDPRRHFDPMGAIVYVALMVFTGGRFAIGWAKPVPINPFNFRDPRRDFMLSSLAGPAANMLQALLWSLALGGYARVGGSSTGLNPIGFMIFFGIVINVVLAVFNLIPIPPLDGSRVLAWMLPERVAYHLDQMERARIGMLIIFALLFLLPGAWSAMVSAVVDPVVTFFLRIAAAAA
jgi:Zn-dependent protease